MIRMKKTTPTRTLWVPDYIGQIAQAIADQHGYAPSSVVQVMLRLGCETYLEQRERSRQRV